MIDLPHIRNITVSGRIASGSTTLAKKLAQTLSWQHIEGGEVFWEAVRSRMGLDAKDTDRRPDTEDTDFDASLKKLLSESSHLVVETKLAGFNAQNIPGIFKILVLCQDKTGVDQTQIRIDRLVNREGMTIEQAKEEVLHREKSDIEKWRRLYAPGDSTWTYWDSSYYDLVINTYLSDQQKAFEAAINALGVKLPLEK